MPATANVTAARLRHGPANVALDTRYRPGGTSTVAGRVERHASAHARRNGPAASAAPSGRAPYRSTLYIIAPAAGSAGWNRSAACRCASKLRSGLAMAM